MKRKIICMSMIGLLLLTGVASFSAAKPMEQNTPVVKSEGAQYDINIFGNFGINILILPLKGVDFKYTIKIDGKERISGEGPIFPFGQFYHQSVSNLRLIRVLTSLGGLLEVTVEIPDTLPLQKETRTGKIVGPFVVWDK